jgi:hypothetical protein
VKIRVPYGRLDERLDAKSLWQLPNVLDDPEERLVCRELLSECHRVGMRGVGEVLMGLEGVEPALRRRLSTD